jgi:hypothetical protein
MDERKFRDKDLANGFQENANVELIVVFAFSVREGNIVWICTL